MDEALAEENRVPGCLSVVHARDARRRPDTVRRTDAQLTKALVALLVNGLSGCTNEQIQKVDPSFIQEAGLAQSLTPGRNNGFVNMLALMKKRAVENLPSSDNPPSSDNEAELGCVGRA